MFRGQNIQSWQWIYGRFSPKMVSEMISEYPIIYHILLQLRIQLGKEHTTLPASWCLLVHAVFYYHRVILAPHTDFKEVNHREEQRLPCCTWVEQPFSNGAKQYVSTDVLVANHHAGSSSIWMNIGILSLLFPLFTVKNVRIKLLNATAYLELEQQEEIWSEKLTKLNYEAKVEESEEASSCWELNPEHLWLEPPIVYMWYSMPQSHTQQPLFSLASIFAS